MCAPKVLHLVAVDHLGSRPTLRRAQHDHWPCRPFDAACPASLGLQCANLQYALLRRRGHCLVHGVRIAALDKVGFVTEPKEEVLKLTAWDTRKNRRIGDLVAIQVQHRKHRSITDGVQEFVGMPGSGQRARLGLAISDHAGDDQVGIVESRTKGVREAVAEFASFMDRTGRLGRTVAADPAGK